MIAAGCLLEHVARLRWDARLSVQTPRSNCQRGTLVHCRILQPTASSCHPLNTDQHWSSACSFLCWPVSALPHLHVRHSWWVETPFSFFNHQEFLYVLDAGNPRLAILANTTFWPVSAGPKWSLVHCLGCHRYQLLLVLRPSSFQIGKQEIEGQIFGKFQETISLGLRFREKEKKNQFVILNILKSCTFLGSLIPKHTHTHTTNESR